MKRKSGIILTTEVCVECAHCRRHTQHSIVFFGGNGIGDENVYQFRCTECQGVQKYDPAVHDKLVPVLIQVEGDSMQEGHQHSLIPIAGVCWIVMAAFLYVYGWPANSEDAMTAGLLIGGLIGAFERRRSKRGQLILWMASAAICVVVFYRYGCDHLAVYNFTLTSAYLFTRFLDWAHPE